ncbi:hypothetical protein CHS0354_002550 [Potamilus streckersoni]|uniref:Nitrate/nitrite transporter n=1 Tax=Potamilus streckersoni TaxID=2493646 RepID=A0AAE0VGK6_9BIVA|nr:hypothetical protein CHS0354_002550 [Potamilus streckersoni]
MSYNRSPNLCKRILRKMHAKTITEDEFGKAKSFRLFSISRPHMRGFHASWMGFFVAFTSWFSIQPLIPTITKELGLSRVEIARSGIASIGATIFARIGVGPLCDKFGPRRTMSAILILGSIPLALSGLIRSGIGLLIVRLLIGILGATFIPCQFWTSAMFNVKIIGTANAVVGGWGNLGGGFTFLLMPALFELVMICGADEYLSWKIALVIPAALTLGFGILIIWTTDDCPQGHWSERKIPEGTLATLDKGDVEDHDVKDTKEYKKDEEERESERIVVDEGRNPTLDSGGDGTCCKNACATDNCWLYFTVFVLFVQYGLCFGVEIAVNTVMNLYFLYRFKVENCTTTFERHVPLLNLTNITATHLTFSDTNDCSILTQNTASLIASMFGLMNLFARALGGVFSDLLRKFWAIPGRLLAHLVCLVGEGVMLIVFSQMTTIPFAMLVMIVFSLFVQMSEGTTFALVPYLHPRYIGIISGLIGGGGNAGAIIWNTIWVDMVDSDPSRWFWTLGICVLSGSVLTLLIPIQKKRIWGLRCQKQQI